MKMFVRFVEAHAVPGGVALALTDYYGNVLPNQIGTVVDTSIGDVATATVTFLIDGKNVCLSP